LFKFGREYVSLCDFSKKKALCCTKKIVPSFGDTIVQIWRGVCLPLQLLEEILVCTKEYCYDFKRDYCVNLEGSMSPIATFWKKRCLASLPAIHLPLQLWAKVFLASLLDNIFTMTTGGRKLCLASLADNISTLATFLE
jgi:hypothetical protein